MSNNDHEGVSVSEVRELTARLQAKAQERWLPPAKERRAIREAAGVSQRELAPIVGCCRESINLWEHGRQPQARFRVQYATALRVLQGGPDA